MYIWVISPDLRFCSGLSVLARRKPNLLFRSDDEFPLRMAERAFWGKSFQEAPRATRREQSPLVHALPLFGAETKFESGTGWPSFNRPFDRDHVRLS